MIKEFRLADEKGQGFYTIFKASDFEYVIPVEHFAESFIITHAALHRDMIAVKNLPVPANELESYIYQEAVKEWAVAFKEIQATEIPQNLIALLSTTKKRDQLKLLKNLAISPNQLTAFFIKAGQDFGFTFSQYASEHLHKGLDRSNMPQLVEVKDGKVYKVGSTSLSDGQLKQAVDHRKVVVAKFLDNATSWHCFFFTFDSWKGQEQWKDGQPHYHYLSDQFGLPRQQVVEQLKSSKYSLGTLPHIEMIVSRNKDH